MIKSYLSTLLLMFLLGNEFQSMYPAQFYMLAAELYFYGEDLLLEYCEVAKNPTAELFEKLLKKSPIITTKRFHLIIIL